MNESINAIFDAKRVFKGCFVDKLRKLDNYKLNLKGTNADALIAPSRGTHLMLPGSFSSKNVGMLIPKTKDVSSL